jgi:proteasome lid subunit RPN8/RPN11
VAIVAKLPEVIRRGIISHALDDAPVECCGILASRGDSIVAAYRARNVEESPYRFRIDPLQQRDIEEDIDRSGATLAGFYHSHTGSEARPSPTDIHMMGPLFGPPFVHIVIGVADPENPVVRIFHIIDDRYEEQEYELVADPA